MKATYVFWSERENDRIMTDYTAITGILSMLYWRKFNGSIKLIVDKNSYEFLEKSNILDLGLIDEIDTTLLTSDKAKLVRYKDCHWTWANIFTINNLEDTNTVLIDWDNIYKQRFNPERGIDLTYAHREDVVYPFYPHPKLHIPNFVHSQYAKFNWDVLDYAFNASFLHFNNLEYAQEYSKYAMDYITDKNQQVRKNYDYMNVRTDFVDQLLLAAVGEKYFTKPVFTDIYPPTGSDLDPWRTNIDEKSNYNTDLMEHLWVKKIVVHNFREVYQSYMRRKLDDLRWNFYPYYEKVLDILWRLHKIQLTKDIEHTFYGDYIKYN